MVDLKHIARLAIIAALFGVSATVWLIHAVTFELPHSIRESTDTR